MQIGHNIKNLRKAAGLTQKQLGEKLGISFQSIAQWETGKRIPKIETLRKIAAALNCDISEIDESFINSSTVKAQELPHDALVALYKTTDSTQTAQVIFSKLSAIDQESIINTLRYLQQLNSSGKSIAANRVQELTLIEKYTAPDSSKNSK